VGSLGDFISKYNSIWAKTDAAYETSTTPEDVCPYCGGLGYVSKDVPVGHPDFGKAFPCVCRREDVSARKAEHLRKIGNLGNYAHLTLDNFVVSNALTPPQQANLRTSLSLAHEFAIHPQGWLLFFGGYGCGKTHLAAAIGNHRLSENQPAIFLTVPDLLDHLRTSFGPNSELGYDEMFEQLRDAPLLIMDDLGAESSTQWANEKLYQLFNHRYTRQLPTVVTTNCDLDDLDPRICSRLVDRNLTQMVNMRGIPDYRRHPEAQAADEISNVKIYQHMSFENFVMRESENNRTTSESLYAAMNAAKEFADHPNNQWLILVGKNGCGKTHLAAAVANQRLKQGDPVYFITLPDLLDYLRKAFEPNSRLSLEKRFQEVCSAPVLILDRFDLSAASAWAREKIFQLIEYRYVQFLPTMITKAGDSIEDLDPAFRARFSDSRFVKVVPIAAPPFKGGSSMTANPNNQRPRR
jgi:DNA replication protein DnaC